MSTLVGILISCINILDSIQTTDVTRFGVSHPLTTASEYTIVSPGSGINYETNTIYIIGGVVERFTLQNNPYYITWNGLNTTDWNGTNDYFNIKTPPFNKTLINTSILTTIIPEQNGKWYCESTSCSTQINKEPYIYIIGERIFDSNNNSMATDKMLIFDMNINDYISPSKYKYQQTGLNLDGL